MENKNEERSQTSRNAVLVGIANDELGLYDSSNGNSIKAYKIVDATEIANNSKRCVIKYGLSVRGVIAQINDWYEADIDLGVSLHYQEKLNTDWTDGVKIIQYKQKAWQRWRISHGKHSAIFGM